MLVFDYKCETRKTKLKINPRAYRHIKEGLRGLEWGSDLFCGSLFNYASQKLYYSMCYK